jgi:hypothetical protein
MFENRVLVTVANTVLERNTVHSGRDLVTILSNILLPSSELQTRTNKTASLWMNAGTMYRVALVRKDVSEIILLPLHGSLG